MMCRWKSLAEAEERLAGCEGGFLTNRPQSTSEPIPVRCFSAVFWPTFLSGKKERLANRAASSQTAHSQLLNLLPCGASVLFFIPKKF